MPDLEPDQVHRLRQQLLAREQSLGDEIALRRGVQDEEKSARSSPGPHDRGEESAAEQADDNNTAVIKHWEQELRAVRSALGRVDNGSYGDCESCGEFIPFARLHAYPEANRCLTCQEESENQDG